MAVVLGPFASSLVFRSIIGASMASQKYLHSGGGQMSNGISPSILQALWAIIPGMQPGEVAGPSRSPWEAMMAALGEIIPGEQPFLGEIRGAPPGIAPGAVVKTWSTRGVSVTFYKLSDGRIACQKKDGTWKIWRPAKHLVISRNPKVNALLRADKKIDKLMKALARRAGVSRRRARPAARTPYAYLSPVELKQLGRG